MNIILFSLLTSYIFHVYYEQPQRREAKKVEEDTFGKEDTDEILLKILKIGKTSIFKGKYLIKIFALTSEFKHDIYC